MEATFVSCGLRQKSFSEKGIISCKVPKVGATNGRRDGCSSASAALTKDELECIAGSCDVRGDMQSTESFSKQEARNEQTENGTDRDVGSGDAVGRHPDPSGRGQGPLPRPHSWVDCELFAGVVTPATFDPESDPFDELYAGGMGSLMECLSSLNRSQGIRTTTVVDGI